MPDSPEPSKPNPPLPSSGMTGKLKAPTTKLPPVQAGRTGKIVVMLSSVAKGALANTRKLLPAPGGNPVPQGPRPGSPRPAVTPLTQNLSSTTFVKLPPKTTVVPSFVTLTPKSAVAPEKKETKVAPPLLPTKNTGSVRAERTKPDAKAPEPAAPPKVDASSVTPPATPAPKADAPPATPAAAPAKPLSPAVTAKTDARTSGQIRLNPSTPAEKSEPAESIFAEIPEPPATPAPAGWKKLEAGELPLPAGGIKNLDVFEKSQRLLPKPTPVTAVPSMRDKPDAPSTPPAIEARDKPAVAPPMTPAPATKEGPALNPAPVTLPPAHPVNVAPPLIDTPQEEPKEKLPPPHLHESVKSSTPDPASARAPEAAVTPKAPDTSSSTSTATAKAPEMKAPVQPALPPPLPPAKPKEVAKEAPKETPKEALKQAPKEPPKETPKEIAKEAPKEPAKDAPSEPAKEAAPEPPAEIVKAVTEKAAPLVLTSTSRIFVPGLSDGKPALRPAVLPSRGVRPLILPRPEGAPPPVPYSDTSPAAEKPSEPPTKVDAPAKVEPAKSAPTKLESTAVTSAPKSDPAKPAADAGKTSTKTPFLPLLATATAGAAVVTGAESAMTAPPVPPSAPSKKPFTPPTRAERAKNRRVREIALFWVVALVAVAALYAGILHYGRDTRVEGQVIPPDGMTLSDEVWIVSDFSSLASGVADDLAKERVPLQQEIQEAQDHVQRVQADIASREERIRLIRQDIQASKDETNNLVKKAKDDSQALYDGEGAAIEQAYQSKFDELKQAIASRAATNKLQYAPDPAFPSPEVWANAYRLALYETPPGVDGTKEHQWLADQMKQWRDFQKTLDDRNEQLREKAAQVKLSPGPKLTDLNAKIEDLNQRVAGTQAEEEPLKVELTQAQSDLAAARTAESTLDEKYYGQLYSLPSENISYHIPIKPDGRFTWVPDNPFGDGEVKHVYWIFSRAIRGDGRQYWALQQFPMEKNKTTEMTLEPGTFESTKQILRPNLSPDEIEQ